MTKKIMIIGGGLAGLTAAYRLKARGFDVTLLESTGKVGGRVQTVKKDGYTMDTGATALADSYTSYWPLVGELGLQGNVTETSTQTGILRDGVIHALDATSILSSGLKTRLFSLGSKLKLLTALWDVKKAKKAGMLDYTNLAKATPLDNETAGAYAHRRLNSELANYLCDPIVRCMLIADADQISKVELFSGLANIFDVKTFGLEGGLNLFARTLANHFEVKFNCEVTQVIKTDSGVEVSWREGDENRSEQVAGCVVACPVDVASTICIDDQAALTKLANAMPYTKGMSVAFGVTAKPESEVFILQVPAVESRDIAIMFLEHNKCHDSAPEGRGLISCYWENTAAASMIDAPDEDIVARSRALLYRVFPDLEDKVEMVHVTRWQKALPKTIPGAYHAIAEFTDNLSVDSPIQYAGDYLSGAGQNTAVAMGERAAENIIHHLVAP
jgi:protoporphyrinogen/coproporphyrinogen III oxidase